MSTIVKTRLIKIGNSRGIRLPVSVLEQVGMSDQVEVEIESDHLLIRPVARPARDGWEEQFQQMSARGDDRLLDEEFSGATQWDKEEWQW